MKHFSIFTFFAIYFLFLKKSRLKRQITVVFLLLPLLMYNLIVHIYIQYIAVFCAASVPKLGLDVHNDPFLIFLH